ncbi:MAG: metal ABC transporter permease [Alphaproteobacteria bacterium]|nr:metal ABC transporter permease [Alphaproteobacteria bacterium]
MIDLLMSPFTDFAFMRRALAVSVILSLGGAPLGVLLTLRRMTLAGDALAHALLPGVAAAFVAFGLSLWPMTLGAGLAGVSVALLAVLLTRLTNLKEDSSLALIYLASLAGGVVIVSVKGNSVDLQHVLFGNILAIDEVPSLYGNLSRELAGLLAGAYGGTVKEFPLFPLLGVDMPGVYLTIECTPDQTGQVLDKLSSSLQKYFRKGKNDEG